MHKKVIFRLCVSALLAFFSYAAWAYYANSLVTDNTSLLIKAALVQGIYSGVVTLVFTFLLEFCFEHFGAKTYCLAFITPHIDKKATANEPCSTKETFRLSLQQSKQACHGNSVPGTLLSPLPALLLQAILVVSVNIYFATPNLWLTVAPSIIFSALYGYSYTFILAKHEKNEHNSR